MKNTPFQICDVEVHDELSAPWSFASRAWKLEVGIFPINPSNAINAAWTSLKINAVKLGENETAKSSKNNSQWNTTKSPIVWTIGWQNGHRFGRYYEI